MKQIKKTKKEKIKKVLKQVKEPLSLLETLKEEGMANAVMLLSLASGAAKNIKFDNIKPHVQELLHGAGFASKSEVERLESRIEELEDRITQLEAKQIGDEE